MSIFIQDTTPEHHYSGNNKTERDKHTTLEKYKNLHINRSRFFGWKIFISPQTPLREANEASAVLVVVVLVYAEIAWKIL